MDKKSNISSQNAFVSKTVSKNSYITYSSLGRTRRFPSPKKLIIPSLTVVSVLVSVILLIPTIKKVYFDHSTDAYLKNDINSIVRPQFEYGDSIKVENITKNISELFNVPMGVKVIDIDDSAPIFYGLEINDIIVQVSGKKIANVNDMHQAVSQFSNTEQIVYKIYRNNLYQDIYPSDFEE